MSAASVGAPADRAIFRVIWGLGSCQAGEATGNTRSLPICRETGGSILLRRSHHDRNASLPSLGSPYKHRLPA
jgi:hypothetical protein